MRSTSITTTRRDRPQTPGSSTESGPGGRFPGDGRPHGDIPEWTDDPDYFVWDAFDHASADAQRDLEHDALQQEALLAETDRFYVIPDQFGVVDGHVLILPKERDTSSIATLDPSHDSELCWLLDHISSTIAETYGASTVRAEHGECGCTTAAQAHVHVLPVPRTLTREQLSAVVDQVLRRRMIGIERVIYRDAEFTALHDLQEFGSRPDAVLVGQHVRAENLRHDVVYPSGARVASDHSHQYVYFAGPGLEFLSTRSFDSQFVREVVGRIMGMSCFTWNRWENESRDNMFRTYARLAAAFRASLERAYGFSPRAGSGEVYVPQPRTTQQGQADSAA